MVTEDRIEKYIEKYSSAQDSALEWLERMTNLRTNHARMLSGPVVGKFLEFVSTMLRPERILELGCFTGYSSICLARGLADGGRLDTIEINDELEDLIREAFERAGVSDRINLLVGDAGRLIPDLQDMYDLVYIDANKREYSNYYRLVFDKVKPGGYMIADNVLWDGKVAENPVPADAQTQGIFDFNSLVSGDDRVENVILPFRDGLNLIRKLPYL